MAQVMPKSHRREKALAWAWLGSNLGVAMFYAAVRDPHIDPVCSASAWSALAWVFAVLAVMGLVLAGGGVVVAVREGRRAALIFWAMALLVSVTQVVFGVLAAHMATIPCLTRL